MKKTDLSVASSTWRRSSLAEADAATAKSARVIKGIRESERITRPSVVGIGGVVSVKHLIPTLESFAPLTTHHYGNNSIRQPVANDAEHRLDPVLQADLFAFFIRAARIADWDLVDAQVFLGDLRGELRLEAEAVRLQDNAVEDFPAENLVARFHVGKVQVGEQVGSHGEQLVADHVPKVQDAMRLAYETRAIDDVGLAFEDRLDQLGILGGIVFEISVLHDNDVAGGVLKTRAQGGAFALV